MTIMIAIISTPRRYNVATARARYRFVARIRSGVKTKINNQNQNTDSVCILHPGTIIIFAMVPRPRLNTTISEM